MGAVSVTRACFFIHVTLGLLSVSFLWLFFYELCSALGGGDKQSCSFRPWCRCRWLSCLAVFVHLFTVKNTDVGGSSASR